MKLIMIKSPGLAEVELEIYYDEMDDDVRNLVRYIERYDSYIDGADGERQFKVRINDIYYVETVDNKTFLNTKNDVFKCDMHLYELMEKVKFFDFVQISKTCIVNTDAINGIQGSANGRLKMTLASGEKLNVSRAFLPRIKSAFSGEEDDR